nr:LOW QUALITY PROTEIN: mitogen-activated protein kinase kinase kinase 11-like [Penaeus vannamei]
MSMTLSKRDLLTQMVSQTKQHRQQIRSLENELERLRSGDVLNKCEIASADVEWRPGDVVGEGSFSTVYRGHYCGTDVAVKELKFKLSQDDKNYFRSEAALLQQLHHPRVVLMMGVCTTAARPFMLLEYLAGGTLYNLIHNSPRDKLDHAAYFVVAKDVAQGMNYLHKHEPQVLHLDLKSMNVLLDSYYRAKIADFGFSILKRSRAGSPAQRGSIRGTPAWMAPELLTKGPCQAKCDVYSYAIILWEMLTASHPFRGLDIFQIMETIESGGRPHLPVAGVSRELKELITSCWAQNPSLRPSFEEILGALDSAAVPTSWRGVLQNANIGPSLLADVGAARTIIGVVEESVELIRRQLQQQRAIRNSEMDNSPRDRHIPEALETMGLVTSDPARYRPARDEASRSPPHASPTRRLSPARRPSPSRQPAPPGSPRSSPAPRPQSGPRAAAGPGAERRRSAPVARQDVPPPRQRLREEGSESGPQHRPARASAGRQQRARARAARREQGAGPRQTAQRPAQPGEGAGPREPRARDEGQEGPRLEPGAGPAGPAAGEPRPRRQQGPRRPRAEGRQAVQQAAPGAQAGRGESRNFKMSSRDRRAASLETSDERDRRSSSNERRFSSTDRHSELRREIRYKKPYNRERQLSGDKRARLRRQAESRERLADSRDSLGESPNESWTSLEGSSSGGSNHVLDEPEDPRLEKRDRRYSSSPRRRSPERRYSPSPRSPERRRSTDRHLEADFRHSPERWPRSSRSPQRRARARSPEARRAESGSRVGPLVVTSEQLLSQKQRLRPVRPAALSDLTHIPEHSLNDISLILKTAITKRRDAFDEALSGRDSYRSDDMDWSDWH